MKELRKKIIIYGCGGHGRSVADVLMIINPSVSLVFIDDNAQVDEHIYGFKVCREYQVFDEQVFLAIGNNEERKRKFEQVERKNIISVISSTAHRGYGSIIDIGCFVGNFSHIGPEAVISCNTIINTASVIEHEVTIGAHCHIAPNATISGRCTIGDLVFVGVGAVVKDQISICSNVIIGAGTTVVKNIVEPGLYFGNPARRIR